MTPGAGRFHSSVHSQDAAPRQHAPVTYGRVVLITDLPLLYVDLFGALRCTDVYCPTAVRYVPYVVTFAVGYGLFPFT